MNRLTIKESSLICNDKNCNYYTKLKILEDLEEELDFDLITLLKALMEGIYVVNDGYIDVDSIGGIAHYNDGWGFETYHKQLALLFSEYGKTWALTIEELEEE